MPEYTVVSVAPNPREWTSKHGDAMHSYKITLRNADGREKPGVEWSRKQTSHAPAVGQVVDGTVETDEKYGPKFKPTPKAGGGYGGMGPRVRDPAERRAIAMQASQKVAIDAVRLAVEGAGVPDGEDPVTWVTHTVTVVAGELFKQVDGVAK